MSSIEIDQKISDKETELKKLINDHSIVEQEKLKMQRSMLEIQLKKKDLEIALDKSKNNIKQLEIEIKLLTKEFWRQKNSGT